jgi:pimeloyl-ACP methyl ester carboxylesterase
LLSTALGSRPAGPHNVQVTIVAESFGGCLALRLTAAAPQLVKALVLVNPATCYNQSLSGLSSFVSATNLLGLFPQDLYNTAQVYMCCCVNAVGSVDGAVSACCYFAGLQLLAGLYSTAANLPCFANGAQF